MTEIAKAAIVYAEAGVPVFPLHPKDKRPLTTHGFKDATTDAEQIEAWWTEHPDANIGIPTGAASGFVVLDLDGPQGDNSLAELNAAIPTRTSITAKGRHLLFKHPGIPIKTGARVLPDLDVRGDGGYIVAPPSVHPSGHIYGWDDEHGMGWDLPLAPLPLKALEALKSSNGKPAAKLPDTIPEGERESHLVSLGGTLRRLGFSESDILAAITTANDRCDPPLEQKALERIAKSVSRYEPAAERQKETPSTGEKSGVSLSDPEPWDTSISIGAILDEVGQWLSRHLWLQDHSADAVALWVAATWYSSEVYTAPLLALISATKRCGKTATLELITHIVRRGCMTSGIGITSAVLFRLNEKQHPTFMIDEAEKLTGRHADQDLVGMLNAGYRQGAKAHRCVPRGNDFDIVDFDAFGFRALASTKPLWDTIMDRSIVIPLQRKPNNILRERVAGRKVDREGNELARKIRRATDDVRERFADQEESAPRPDWLNDRAADNWAALFAVAALAGGEWPERALAAAKALQSDEEDEQDHGERLIHDIRQIFEESHYPDVIKSGDLKERLNKIETAPWGSYRNGDGITTHKLAPLMKRHGVRPHEGRTGGTNVRGYWLNDLNPVFERYPRNSVTVVTVQAESEAAPLDAYERDERLGMQEDM